jgi:hypothetical protein
VALGQVFSEYFGFPANLHSTSFSTITITYHLGLAKQASSGRSTKRLSLTPLTIKNNTSVFGAARMSAIASHKGDVSPPAVAGVARQDTLGYILRLCLALLWRGSPTRTG